jgi:hypothetical protein
MTASETMDIEEVEVGFVVNLGTLRRVLKGLSINGRRWWIASDPMDSLESHSLTIGHGDPGCVDRLNTLYFKVPVLNDEKPLAGTDRLILLLDCSVISAEQPGLYMESGRVMEDPLADIECFFVPIRRALIAKLRNE